MGLSSTAVCGTPFSRPDAARIVAAALGNVSMLQGHFWLDDAAGSEVNASLCVEYLLEHMPRRDLLLLFSQPFQMMDFMFEHVRFALKTWPWASAQNISWPVFLDNVVPFAFFDEPRDVWWRWRPRFYQLLAPIVAGTDGVTAAVKALAAAVPQADFDGTLAMNGPGGLEVNPGPGVRWKSETSPAMMSPRDVVANGGSCTGTAIVLAAACRAVGIPARVAGCSESSAAGDDHHWIEFFDPSDPGPFGDFWHTKEGTSQGNTGGPWDSPSGPMNGCLKGVAPRDTLHTIWASSWGSSESMPLLWSESALQSTWSRIGGTNRCGAYCVAWGCGANQTEHWTAAECAPKTNNDQ
mmetsp:Transcript_20848/g.49481  ORF Transcript_20848/g.49481 Transcript_20848/m.49481 type:complete len:352 (+) Transcript_20848:1-1056(+)